VNADKKIECIRKEFRPLNMSILVAGEHTGDVERSERTVKEGTRCHVHQLHYTRYPQKIVVGCVTHIIKGSNQLPSEYGLSTKIRPATLITGVSGPNYHQIKKLDFGDYVHTYNVKGRKNTNTTKSVGAIALYSSGNDQGSWYFMSLLTGNRIYRIHMYQWTELTVGNDILNRVNRLALDEEQPLVTGNFRYDWRSGQDMLHDEVSDADDIEEAKYAHVNDINNQDKVPLSPMVTDMIQRKTKKK